MENDQIKQGEKLMVKRFQRSSQVMFHLIDPDQGYWYIIWKLNTTNRGLSLKNTGSLCLWDWRFHVKPIFFFRQFLVVTCSSMSWFWALLDLCIYNPDLWRSELMSYIQNRKCLASNPDSRWPWGQISMKHSDKHRISDTAPG